MASVDGSNEIEFPDRGAGLCAGRGGYAGPIDLVHLVYSVCLVYLVCHVCMVESDYMPRPDRPNRLDRPDRLNNRLLRTADGLNLLRAKLIGETLSRRRHARAGSERLALSSPARPVSLIVEAVGRVCP